MAIYITQQKKDDYGIKTYIADNENDLPNLPRNGNPGSKAIIIETGKRYILNNQHEWKPWESGSTPGPSPEEDIVLVYDGGPVEGY